jgi:hypothetical protein
MAKVIEDYNPQKIEIVKRMLERQVEKGTPMAYEIFVDNFKVVMKTTDLSEYDSYEDLVTDRTKYIRINIYNSLTETVGHTKYVFEMSGAKIPEPEATNNRGLGEVEMNNKIKENIAIERERWDKDQLIKDLSRVELKLQEAEEYIDELQTQMERAKLKPNHWGRIDIAALAGVAIEGVMRKNPHWLGKVPGLEGLAGAIEAENNGSANQIATPTEEAEVTFKRKTDTAPGLTEDEQSYLSFGKEVAENFEDEEIVLLAKIIAELGKDTSQLKTVAQLLGIEVKEEQKVQPKN